MTKLSRLLKLFFIGSYFGFIFEFLIDGVFNYNFNLCLPLLFIYGLGLILVDYIYSHIKQLSLIKRFILYLVILTIFEYIVSIFNILVRKKHTWTYSNGRQISLLSSIVWGFLAILIEPIIKNTK